MTKKKLLPSEDPNYFEYDPDEENASDDDVWDYMYEEGVSVDTLPDPKDKKAYLAYVAKRKAEEENAQ